MQIGDENVHRVRALLVEVFSAEIFVSQLIFEKTSSTSPDDRASITHHTQWFAKTRTALTFRPAYRLTVLGEAGTTQYTWFDQGGGFDRRLKVDEIGNNASEIGRNMVFACDNLTSQRPSQGADVTSFSYNGTDYSPGKGTFKTDERGLTRLAKSNRFARLASR